MTCLVARLKDKNHVKIAAGVDLYLVSADTETGRTIETATQPHQELISFFYFIFLNIDISVIIYVIELNQTFCS